MTWGARVILRNEERGSVSEDRDKSYGEVIIQIRGEKIPSLRASSTTSVFVGRRKKRKEGWLCT